MLNESFTTHITFTSGDSHKEVSTKDSSDIWSTIMRLCEGPSAAMGIIKRAIIVDELDRICVEIKGRNIVYPAQLGIQQRHWRRAQKAQKRSDENNLGGE